MKGITEPREREAGARNGAPARLWRRLVWFVALWLAGVVAVGAVAMILRQLLLLPGT